MSTFSAWCLVVQVHTNTQLLAENSQKAVALRLGGDAMARVHSENAKARPVLRAHNMIGVEPPASCPGTTTTFQCSWTLCKAVVIQKTGPECDGVCCVHYRQPR